MNPAKRALSGCRSLLLALGLIAAAPPHGTLPSDTPVERLVTNLGRYVKEHPEDPDGWYRLGRVHTLALETKLETVLVDPDDAPAEGTWAKQRILLPKDATPSTHEQVKRHLVEAIANLERAIALRPLEPRYRLTLACALEAGEPLLAEVEVWPLFPPPDPRPQASSRPTDEWRSQAVAELATKPERVRFILDAIRESSHELEARASWLSEVRYVQADPAYREALRQLRALDWHDLVEDQYFTALCLALPSNGKADRKPVWGDLWDWTSYEAAKNFLRVVGKREPRANDRIRVAVAKAAVESFEALPPPNAITPIVFSLDGPRSLRSLLAPDARVAFDLDGTGRAQTWPWVRHDTGILVWDPAHTGRIDSGRRLVGSVTWWLFFRNGFEALDALDDDRDGELAGKELRGLAVWTDRNGDGVSQRDEVVPIESLGIVALATRGHAPDECDPRSSICPKGLRLADGRVLPTWDWVTDPAPRARP